MASSGSLSRKKPVNLTLSQSVVADAKRYSDNLSATVEELLAEYVVKQQSERQSRLEEAQAAIADWVELHDRIGSIADEYSPL